MRHLFSGVSLWIESAKKSLFLSVIFTFHCALRVRVGVVDNFERGLIFLIDLRIFCLLLLCGLSKITCFVMDGVASKFY